MESFLMILIMLAAIGLSNMINHIVPFIPVPLIQIALGVLIAAVPGGLHIPLEPELFLSCLLPRSFLMTGKTCREKPCGIYASRFCCLLWALFF